MSDVSDEVKRQFKESVTNKESVIMADYLTLHSYKIPKEIVKDMNELLEKLNNLAQKNPHQTVISVNEYLIYLLAFKEHLISQFEGA